MIKADYHLHTNFSSDSKTPMEEMVKQAISLGLDRICFTDHMDYDFPKQYEMSFQFCMEDYWKQIDQMQKKYPQIQILKGVECGLQDGLGERYRSLIQSFDFDFVINSCHVLFQMDPYYPDFWENRTEQKGIEDYFKQIHKNLLEFQDFDVCGHIDYIIRYAPSHGKDFNPRLYMDYIDEILKTVISMGKGIEANSSGYKYGLNTTHPCKEILTRYRELGGEILTIGSDGHQPEHMAFSFDKVQELLLKIGFRYYTIFEKRKPSFLRLDS